MKKNKKKPPLPPPCRLIKEGEMPKPPRSFNDYNETYGGNK
jgi:hypothetical protein